MAEEYSRLARDVNRALVSIRQSLEAPYVNPRRFGESWERVRTLYLAIEQLRFTFNSRLDRFRSETTSEEWDAAAEELLDSFSDILDREEFRDLIGDLRLRRVGARAADDQLSQALNSEPRNLRDAIVQIGDFVASVGVQPPSSSATIERIPEQIRAVVPQQQRIAPVQFEIVDHKIVVVSQPADSLPEDRSNVSAAKAQLVENGQRIIEQLNNSNCDKRLLENVQELQHTLERNVDIVRLGLSSIGCEIMVDAFHEELPTAVAAMLKAQTFGINMYVGQFPEWHRFTDQAASAQLTQEDAPIIAAAAARLANELRDAPEAADPEVPRTLDALNKLLADPKKATKRAIFAVWRSIENLVIKVFRFGADFVEKTATKTSDKLSTAAARAAVVVLMSAALATAVSVTPVASHIAESAWITRAVDLVEQQIATIK